MSQRIQTWQEAEYLIATYGGNCMICGNTPESFTKLVVDHDHVTNFIRGLICTRCNVGLGLLGDSTESLRKALAYLESPPLNIPIEHMRRLRREHTASSALRRQNYHQLSSNDLSGAAGARKNRNKTHCQRGHPFEGDNLYIDARGWRQCRTCWQLTKEARRTHKKYQTGDEIPA